MTTLLRIAERVINRPLLILPDKLAIITEVLAGRIGIDTAGADFRPRDPAALAALDGIGASRFAGDAHDRASGRALPYKRTAEGVAVITVVGSLINRGAWVGASSGLTSYEGIAFQIESAARDPKVKSILLDIESPGGEAVGAFETAALVRKAGEAKPVHAVVNGMAASAAYAIASACKTITTTPSGLSGSIGVVLLHGDYSRAIDRAGITPTLVFAGKHKTDGSPYTPLSGEVRADLQAEVDRFYDLFLETVAAGRGKRLSAKAARATEARTFIGRAAQEAGLVDDIADFGELLGVMNQQAARSAPRSTRRAEMLDARKFDPQAGYDWESKQFVPAPSNSSPNNSGPSADSWDEIISEQNRQLANRTGGRSANTGGAPAQIDRQAKAALDPELAAEASKTPRQAGAVPWSSIADELNAASRRARGAAR